MRQRLFLVFLAGTSLLACTPKEKLFVAADLTREHLFTEGIEGPATDKYHNLYVVDYDHDGTIGIIKPDGQTALFVELPDGRVGNGIRFNEAGDMFVADYVGHAILKIDMDTKEVTVFASDSSMNQPNDIAIATNGTLYASDPNWKDTTGNLWRIDTDGTTHLLESDMNTTNGVEVSPDNLRLYVNESISRKVWVYDLDAAGAISNKTLFYQFAEAGLDGMRCDVLGNLYIARYDAGVVSILSPEGALLREVNLKGKKPTNVSFGGEDGRTVYVTMQDRGAIEYFRSDTKSEK